ncbi:MAG: GntR family transcriptional regulator [Verrucomicrobiales bacterium]
MRSTREQITDTLRAEILCGEWSNDLPVREHTLAKRFGVSRGPVRDSLLQLSQEGVLIYQTNKGVRINTPPAEEQRQLLQSMRRQMETFCLNQCIRKLTKADDKQLKAILTSLTLACDRGRLSAIADNDLALHRHLVRRASYELESVWLGITSRLLMDYSRIDKLDEIVTEHAAIVEAICNRDLKGAQKALIANII